MNLSDSSRYARTFLRQSHEESNDENEGIAKQIGDLMLQFGARLNESVLLGLRSAKAALCPYADTAERPLSGGTARVLALDECLAEQFDLVVSVLPGKLPQQLLLQRHMIMLPKYTQRARRRHNEQLRDLAGQHFVVEPCSN